MKLRLCIARRIAREVLGDGRNPLLAEDRFETGKQLTYSRTLRKMWNSRNPLLAEDRFETPDR